MTGDEILSMAREAGIEGEFRRGNVDELAKFAKIAIARYIAHSPPPPLMIKMSDVDRAQLATMLSKAPAMPVMPPSSDDSALATERAARIEAQTRLAHRKTVQEAVCEARKDALKDAMNACLNLQPPESCTSIEKSLWNIAMMQCANEIENLMGAV